MSRAREGLLVGVAAALIVVASGSPAGASTTVRPVRHDTATCLAPLSSPYLEPPAYLEPPGRPSLPLVVTTTDRGGPGGNGTGAPTGQAPTGYAEGRSDRTALSPPALSPPALGPAALGPAALGPAASGRAAHEDPGVLQPAPRQHGENCAQKRYEGEFGVPLWRGPPWGVPSLGGMA